MAWPSGAPPGARVVPLRFARSDRSNLHFTHADRSNFPFHTFEQVKFPFHTFGQIRPSLLTFGHIKISFSSSRLSREDCVPDLCHMLDLSAVDDGCRVGSVWHGSCTRVWQVGSVWHSSWHNILYKLRCDLHDILTDRSLYDLHDLCIDRDLPDASKTWAPVGGRELVRSRGETLIFSNTINSSHRRKPVEQAIIFFCCGTFSLLL